MATSGIISTIYLPVLDTDRHDLVGLILSAVVPLAAFVIVHGLARMNGLEPLFFSPLGLPVWMGATFYIVSLPLFGAARWMVSHHGSAGRRAGWWVVGLIAATVALPFVVAPMDMLGLTVISFVLFMVGLGAIVRVAKVAPRAALVMVPGLVWMGFGAFLGLSLSASWGPPFAVTNSQGGA